MGGENVLGMIYLEWVLGEILKGIWSCYFGNGFEVVKE